MNLPTKMANDLKVHAARLWPNEAVALIGFGNDHEPKAVVKLANRSAEPTLMFLVMPAEHYEADMAIRRAGFYVGAVFHSHPKGRPRPSVTDLEMYEDGKLMIIAGREGDAGWVLRAWDGAREIPINEPVTEPV